MQYNISIDGKRKKVILEPAPSSGQAPGKDQRYVGSVGDDASRQIAKKLVILKSEPSLITVSLEGKVSSVVPLKRGFTSVTFVLDGRYVEASIQAPATSRDEAYSEAASTSEVVTSNFSAKIVKVSASKGDSLKEGDTLIVLEAMKMEAQIRVPRACKVQEILVKEGEMVERGKILARLNFL